jgi:hypothetical protein
MFREVLRNKISKVCFCFCSTVRNSEHFSLARNGSERNSESFCSAEQPGFHQIPPIVPSIPSSAEQIFLSEIANHTQTLARTTGKAYNKEPDSFASHLATVAGQPTSHDFSLHILSRLSIKEQKLPLTQRRNGEGKMTEDLLFGSPKSY